MILSSEIFQKFSQWLAEAKQNDPTYYNGMSLATVNAAGQPSNRVVLLKSVDESGFTFFTNYESHKGDDISHNSHVAVTFWWSDFQRQIRIEGTVAKTSREESANYFAHRPLLSQVAAVISEQSRPIESLQALEQKFEQGKKTLGDNITCPEYWGGYHIDAHKMEFWQGKDHRLHERHVYSVQNDQWVMDILQP